MSQKGPSGLMHCSKSRFYSITLSAWATNPVWNFEAKLLRRLEVDDQVPMNFLKERHLCWLAAIENFDDLRSDALAPAF